MGVGKVTLFINACVRGKSRTYRLAEHLLEKLDGEVQEVRLEDIQFPVADEAFLNHRDALIAAGRFDDPLFALARQFAGADTIVVGAPYWDLSFPSALKQYFEQINVLGITFAYRNDMPYGLCKAQKLYYITTAGGPVYSDDFGFGYVRALAQIFYGIQDVKCFKAENLDILGADPEKIVKRTMAEMDGAFGV